MSDVGYIVIIKRSGKDGDSYPMCQSTCTIGKHLDSDIRVQLDTVSAKHASISVMPDGKCVLRSLSATNPVHVNGVALFKSSQKVLAHKDVITIGDRLLRWEYSASSSQHPHSQSSAFVFSTPTKFVGMSTPKRVAGSASAKKRKMPSLESSESSASKRKRVSFGPYLSPEQFDQQLPTSTPVRKGEKPNFSSPIAVGSPMVSGPRQLVKDNQGKASPIVAKSSGDTPKSLLRRRSPTPIKPYLAQSLGFAVPTSASKKTAKSPSSIRTSKAASGPKSPKAHTPSLILKQRKLVKSHPSASEASTSPHATSRARSESPRGGHAGKSKALSSRSRSVGPVVRGRRHSSAGRAAKFSRNIASPKSAVKSSNKLRTPKKKRESSFTVTSKVSPSMSSPRHDLSSKKKAQVTSFNVTPKNVSRKSPGEKSSMDVHSFSSKKSLDMGTTPKTVQTQISRDTTPVKAPRAQRTPKNSPMFLAKKTSSLKKTPKSLAMKTPSPKKTPKSLTKKTPPTKKTPKSFTKKTPSPKKTPKSLTKKTPSPKKTPKSLTKKTPSPKRTPKSLTKKTPSPKKTPKSLTKKTPSPKKTPKSLTKKTPKSLEKKTPKKSPKSLTKKMSHKKTPGSLSKYSPKSSVKKNSPKSSSKKESHASPKLAQKNAALPSKTSPKQQKSVTSKPVPVKSTLKVLARKTPRLAWHRGSFASVVKRSKGQAVEAKQHTATSRRALKAIVKAREFKAKKNKALNKPTQESDLQLTQDVPKKFHFGAVSSTGHANSPAPIIIYKKIQKTPEVFRKGRKSIGRSTVIAGALDLSGVEALMTTPVKPHGRTADSATKSPASLRSEVESSTHSPRSASKSPTPRSASKSHTPRSASKSHTPRSASKSHTPRSASKSRTPRSASKSHTPRSASKSHTPRSASKSHTPRSASKSHTPRSASKSHTPRSASKSPILRSASKSPTLSSASKSCTPKSVSKLTDMSPKSIRKSDPDVSKSPMRTPSSAEKFSRNVPKSKTPMTTPSATESEQSNVRSPYSARTEKSVRKSVSPLKSPKSLRSQGRIVKTPKSVNSSLRNVRSLIESPQGSKSASRASASLHQTLLSMEAIDASFASRPARVTAQSGSLSSVASSSQSCNNSPKQSSSPLFMPSLAENGSRLGDFTSRKSLGIHPPEPRMRSTRRAQSLGGSGNLTPTQLRKLFATNAQSAAGSKLSQSSTSSPSSRSSSRLDFTSVETPDITQERFISPLGTPQYKQPDAMLLSSLTAKQTPSSPARASSSIKGRGPNVAIVNPIQRQAEVNQSPSESSGKQLNATKSPYSSYSDVVGMKQLLRTPHTPKDDLRNVSGLKTLFQKRLSAADYTNVENIKKMFASDCCVSLNDSTLASLSALVNSPMTSGSTFEIHEVLNVVTSPPKPSSPSIQIVSSTRSPLSRVRKSPAPDKAPVVVVDISSDEDAEQISQSGVQRRASRSATPASGTRGTKRTTDVLDESPMRRNTRGRVDQSSQSTSSAKSPASSLVRTEAKSLVETAKTPAKSLAKPPAKSPAKPSAKSPAKPPAKSPAKPLAKSPAKTPAKSPEKTPTGIRTSSPKSPEKFLDSPPQPLLRRTRGRPAKAKGKTTSPVTKGKTSPAPKVTRRGRRGKAMTASPTQDSISASVSTPAPVVSPKVTRRGRATSALKKVASPVAASPANGPPRKSPTPVKRTTRGRKVAAVVSTPVKKATPGKKPALVKKGTPAISPVKSLAQSKVSPKKSTTPVKRTTRGRRAAAVPSTPVKVSPVKETSSGKKSSKEQTLSKETPKTTPSDMKSSGISPKKTRGRKTKAVSALDETPVKASLEVAHEDKSSDAKRPSRSRAAAKKASPQKTKTTVAKDSPRKARKAGGEKATPDQSQEGPAVEASPVEIVSSPSARKVTRGRRAAAKIASPKSTKTPSPLRPTRQTRRRAAQK